MNHKQIDEIFPYNYALLLKEFLKRNYKLEQIGDTQIVIASSSNRQKTLCFDLAPPSESYNAGWIANDKFYTKQFLIQRGFSVPKGHAFYSNQLEAALKYAQKINFPVVLKPTTGAHGNHVFSKITSVYELQEKIYFLRKHIIGEFSFIVEEYVPGNEYRLFITKDHFFAAVHRVPASVTGDGKHTINELITSENHQRMHPRTTCLCTIKIDEVLLEYLEKNNLDLSYIPAANETIQLRLSSNVSMGGDCIGITSEVHPDFIELAKEILASIPGMKVLGIDLICKDITKNIRSQSYSICEINTSPGLSLHTVPSSGESKNTPSAIADIFFTEEKQKITVPTTTPYKVNPSLTLQEALIEKGCTITTIPHTDIWLYAKNGHENICIGKFLPLIPHNIGLIMANTSYVNAIIQHHGLKVFSGILAQDSHQQQSKNLYKVTLIITDDNYFWIHAEQQPTISVSGQNRHQSIQLRGTNNKKQNNLPLEIQASYQAFANNILDMFPQAPWLHITTYVPNLNQPVKKHTAQIASIDLDMQSHPTAELVNYKTQLRLNTNNYLAIRMEQELNFSYTMHNANRS